MRTANISERVSRIHGLVESGEEVAASRLLRDALCVSIAQREISIEDLVRAHQLTAPMQEERDRQADILTTCLQVKNVLDFFLLYR